MESGEATLTLADQDTTEQELARRAGELWAMLAAGHQPDHGVRWPVAATAMAARRGGRRLAGGTGPPDAAAWLLRTRILAALDALQAADVRKVVVAASRSVRLLWPTDPLTVLARLRGREPHCFRYLVQPRYYRALIGASPGRLVSVEGAAVRSSAVSGFAAAGHGPEEDLALGNALLHSAADRDEHALVVDFGCFALTPLARTIAAPDHPELLSLATAQHLCTPIEATLAVQRNTVDLAALLHHTPAVTGMPRDAATAVVRRIEGEPRGMFGGLVGWLDADGNGDLAVASPCLLLKGDRLTAYAGAGITAGWLPDAEIEAVDRKLDAALSVLGDRLAHG